MQPHRQKKKGPSIFLKCSDSLQRSYMLNHNMADKEEENKKVVTLYVMNF